MSPRRRITVKTSQTVAYVLFAGVGVIVVGLVLLTSQLPRLLDRPVEPAPAEAPAATDAAPEEARKISATLFFVAASGTELVPVTRDVAYGATPAALARRIAEAQLQPPPEGLFSAIPAGTMVRSVFLTPRGEAFVDLSREMITRHAGGSMNEALSVYAIVNAMVMNLPDVSAVQILIDGQEVDSIAGHLDLRHPLRRSTQWVRKGQ